MIIALHCSGVPEVSVPALSALLDVRVPVVELEDGLGCPKKLP